MKEGSGECINVRETFFGIHRADTRIVSSLSQTVVDLEG